LSKKILIVDDSFMLRGMLIDILNASGYINVTESQDGYEALGKIDQDNFDLIITDINMPNMDGLEFIQKVRKIDRYIKIPILVLTTERDESVKAKGKEAGATGWITKPLSDNIIEVIDMVLKKGV
jgi:two-component system chemotaxis response regulator CheY